MPKLSLKLTGSPGVYRHSKTYYGWVNLYIDRSDGTITVEDYAYNSDAGDPIYAGQTR